MRAFGRFLGSFLLMIALGYLAVVTLLPPPSSGGDGSTGATAADRLAQEASALLGRKPASTIESGSLQ